MVKMMSNITLNNRFCVSGPIFRDIHMIDLYLYDSSLFANVLVVQDSEYLLIIDSGTSKTANIIINYLNFYHINGGKIILLPTHYHFDHVGGINKLVHYFKEKGYDAQVYVTKEQKSRLIENDQNLRYFTNAKKVFKGMVGDLKPVNEAFLHIIDERAKVSLGNKFSLSIIKTPGHSPDHISPIITNKRGERICFFGEALGINLKNDYYPLPASSAPDFNSKDYINSIEKIIKTRPDIGIFSHFGGIHGKYNIIQTCRNSIEMLDSFQKHIKELYEKYHDTRKISEIIYNEYEDYITTLALNSEISRNLAFTIVYGVLIDLGIKKLKDK
ncbi:MAG: MBL fold metallo-hydrolase [Promethearchaeota archaeon]